MDVTGDLTLHGVTKSVTVPMEMAASARTPEGNVRTGFRTKFTLHRSDYGMKFGIPNMVGDDVEMIVSLEAITQ